MVHPNIIELQIESEFCFGVSFYTASRGLGVVRLVYLTTTFTISSPIMTTYIPAEGTGITVGSASAVPR